MPMRQPCGSSAPACSPATSSGVVPSASTSLPLARKRTRPPLAAEARRGDDGPEALEVESLGHAGALEAVGQRVQQAGRTAGPGLALAPVGHAPVELGNVPPAVPVVVVLVQRVAAWPRASARSSRPKIVSLGRRGDVHVRDVGQAARAVRERSQHPHDRRHAAAGRHEQQRMLDGFREDELPGRRREPDHHARGAHG